MKYSESKGQRAVMAGHGFVMFEWRWIEASVLGSQVFVQASMEGCDMLLLMTERTLIFKRAIKICLQRPKKVEGPRNRLCLIVKINRLFC